jgi:hypothetical protein
MADNDLPPIITTEDIEAARSASESTPASSVAPAGDDAAVSVALESESTPASEPAPTSTPASSEAVWGLKKFGKHGKHRMGHTLTMGDKHYVVEPVPSDSTKKLKGFKVTIKGSDGEVHELEFVARNARRYIGLASSRLRGMKADDDARERAMALVREHAGLQVGFTRKDAEITEFEDFQAAKTRQESKERRVKKIAAAMKRAEPIKTALPEFADDSDVPAYDGITWYSNKDGGCEGRTHGRNGTWVIIPTIDGGRHFAAYHPHGAMNIDDRKEIGTFSMIEEAQAACEKDRVSQEKETAA